MFYETFFLLLFDFLLSKMKWWCMFYKTFFLLLFDFLLSKMNLSIPIEIKTPLNRRFTASLSLGSVIFKWINMLSNSISV